LGKDGVVVVRIGEDIYALDDRCSHQNVRLSAGEVLSDEVEIECYKHGSTFSLETGQVMSLPATKPVLTHLVSVENGTVYLESGDMS
jgi:3-phenylpropionate/trans-cinnamate dioxygenase ferredoxin subunit